MQQARSHTLIRTIRLLNGVLNRLKETLCAFHTKKVLAIIIKRQEAAEEEILKNKGVVVNFGVICTLHSSQCVSLSFAVNFIVGREWLDTLRLGLLLIR